MSDTPKVTEDPQIPFCYQVASSDPGRHHTVDLTQRFGYGVCTCESFQFRCLKNFRENDGLHVAYDPGNPFATDCKHLEAAKDHYYLTVTVPMLHRFRSGIAQSAEPMRGENGTNLK